MAWRGSNWIMRDDNVCQQWIADLVKKGRILMRYKEGLILYQNDLNKVSIRGIGSDLSYLGK